MARLKPHAERFAAERLASDDRQRLLSAALAVPAGAENDHPAARELRLVLASVVLTAGAAPWRERLEEAHVRVRGGDVETAVRLVLEEVQPHGA